MLAPYVARMATGRMTALLLSDLIQKGIVHIKDDRKIYLGRNGDRMVNRLGHRTIAEAAIAQHKKHRHIFCDNSPHQFLRSLCQTPKSPRRNSARASQKENLLLIKRPLDYGRY